MVADDQGHLVRAGVDLNAADGTPTPRLRLATGDYVEVDADFARRYRALSPADALSEDNREEACRDLVGEPNLTLRAGLDFSYGVGLLGTNPLPLRGFDGATNTFLPNLIETGLQWRHNLSAETRLTAAVELGLHGETFVLPWQGLQIQTPQPDVHGSAEFFTHGYFLSAGIRHSLLGAESFENAENFTVSRSWTHYYGLPTFETGVRTGYRNQYFEATVGLINGWNNFNYTFDNNNHPSFLGSLAVFPTDDFVLRASVIAGPEKDGNTADMRYVGDFHLAYRGRPVGVMANLVYGSEETQGRWDQWLGVYGALRVHPNNWPVSAFARAEYFSDSGSRFGRTGQVFGLTGGVSAHLVDFEGVGRGSHHLEIRSEARSDWDITPGATPSASGPLGRGNVASLGFQILYEGELPFWF